MPKYNVILNLPGFAIRKVSGYQPMFSSYLMSEYRAVLIAIARRCVKKIRTFAPFPMN